MPFPFGSIIGGSWPVVTSVSSDAVPLAGGTIVQIMGSGFATATAVTFGGTNATSFTVVNDQNIQATVPAGSAAGFVEVAVFVGASRNAPNSLLFYYPTGALFLFRGDQNVTSSGGNVTAWGDFSGNSNNQVVGNASFPPSLIASAYNGKPGVQTFEVATQPHYLVGTMGSAYTGTTIECFVVALRPSSPTTGGRILSCWDNAHTDDGTPSTAFSLQDTLIGDGKTHIVRNSSNIIGITGPSTSGAFVESARFDGTHTWIRLNGTDSSQGNSSGALHITNFSAAAGYASSATGAFIETSMTVMEHVCFDHPLTSPERDALKAQWNRRYTLNVA